ncbi:MAG: DUF4479 and tRNA-binding domain-containing protein [Lentilactobacillus buchneri]|jgi:tRNA-binding protein|nr:DUF4479 and tRNA-binding domain-containing protein [Lentilactobacillus buchneri]MCI1950562.1 DUF4479 and tRNA-binding domain-containing protein [Lentilactobacillus buchneri]MCI2018411.1 DUF4479 and tRNA-binding domain-containing protein [Lentilactobacillus buchneri]MCI2027951.1 DUF4479 and tRNA-binding domain-containing protein [Lentilactobacillus buchneri]
MLIASYNPKNTGDTMVVIINQDVDNQETVVHDNVARIYDSKTDQTLGYNFLKASQILPEVIDQNGQIDLTEGQVQRLNQFLTAHGFPGDLKADEEARFVVGYVKTMTDHPRSDHLKITTTEVDNGQEVQIVSGSPNMQAGIKVVVAKIGAMMPNGLIIWPGELRGVESDGMICSGRELHIPHAPQVPGALILPDDYQAVGKPFDFKKAQHLFS